MKTNKLIDIKPYFLDAFENANNNNTNDLFNYNMCISRSEYEQKKRNEIKQYENELLNFYKNYDEANKTNKYELYKKQLNEYKTQKRIEKVKSKVERIMQIIFE